jgi:hypothetical protein
VCVQSPRHRIYNRSSRDADLCPSVKQRRNVDPVLTRLACRHPLVPVIVAATRWDLPSSTYLSRCLVLVWTVSRRSPTSCGDFGLSLSIRSPYDNLPRQTVVPPSGSKGCADQLDVCSGQRAKGPFGSSSVAKTRWKEDQHLTGPSSQLLSRHTHPSLPFAYKNYDTLALCQDFSSR